MDTLSYKTISMNKNTVKKEWVVVDATDQVLGRLCSKVAKLLRGQHTGKLSQAKEECALAEHKTVAEMAVKEIDYHVVEGSRA